MIQRCPWAGNDPLYIAYHDQEWGVPLHDSRKLFEFLILEGLQAGLSWLTVLKKRVHYQEALHHFDPRRIAAYDEAKIAELLTDKGLIRNRAKMAAMIDNAQAYLRLETASGSFSDYLWNFMDGRPICNAWRRPEDVPSQTEVSKAMSLDLKRKGFKFVGPTICYALMQAVGMVNDHLVSCFRYTQV